MVIFSLAGQRGWNTLELSLNRGQETQGYFVGLGAIELNTIPEPATASLSILGMAALMMRRRRR